MNDLIDVNDNALVPMISDNTLIQLAEQAEQRLDALVKLKRVALKATNISDWVDQNGKPYLFASGSEKVARLFGISWQIDEPVYETEEGGHFSYTYKGRFSLAGATIEAIGTRSSKDPFFKKYMWEGEGEKKTKTELPPSAIDKGDVKKSAYTNLLANGVTRLLGLRNLTYDDLAEYAKITKDMIQRVDYKKKGEKNEDAGKDYSKISDAQRKRFFAIAKGNGKTEADMKVYLQDLIGSSSSADIPKEQYDEACAWAEAKTRDPGQEG